MLRQAQHEDKFAASSPFDKLMLRQAQHEDKFAASSPFDKLTLRQAHASTSSA
jgi:hypothetical protein